MSKKEREPKVITAYKGFDKKFQCRGFQYEVGQTYEQDRIPVLCETGFHACEYPLDVFGYYESSLSQYAQVEASGQIEKGDDKIVSSKLTITAALDIPQLVSAAIEYTTERCDPTKKRHSEKNQSASSATGYRSASSATGYRSASSATGYRSASSATGDNAIAAAFGLDSRARAGKTGIVVVAWWDKTKNRKRLCVGYVGENGIKSDTWYAVDADGNLVETT